MRGNPVRTAYVITIYPPYMQLCDDISQVLRVVWNVEVLFVEIRGTEFVQVLVECLIVSSVVLGEPLF